MAHAITAPQMRRAALAAAISAATVLVATGAADASPPGHHRAGGLPMAQLTHVIRHEEPYRFNEFVATFTGTLRNGAWGSAETFCPAGYMVTGGGASIGPTVSGLPRGIVNAYVTTSEAVPGINPPTAWLAVVTNRSGSSTTVSEQAICARLVH